MKTVRVAAGIIQRDNEVLAVQRGYGEMDGLWEFPGGKIDANETPEEACRRELREELDVRITSLQDFYTLEYDYPDFHLSMNCFLCHLDEEGGEPARNDRQRDMRWVHKGSLATLEWMPADIELVNMLVRMGEEEEQALVRRRAAVRKSMQGNKRRDTKPELLVRQRLRAAGLTGYRLDWAKAPGRPDIAFPGRKIAIFVNGCYWHRCPHCNPSMPSKNVEFWEAKFRRNVERDARALAELEELGWCAITIWECELKRDRIDETMERVIETVSAASRGKAARTTDASEQASAHAADSETKPVVTARSEETSGQNPIPIE